MSVLGDLFHHEDQELEPKPSPLEIYQLFPRKVGRRKALEEISKAIRRLQNGESGKELTYEEAVQGLLVATNLFSRSIAGNRGHYTPHPSTWFHQSRYLDDPEEWNRDGSTASLNAISAQNYLAHKKRSSSGIPASHESAVDVAKSSERQRLRLLGIGSGPVLYPGD